MRYVTWFDKKNKFQTFTNETRAIAVRKRNCRDRDMREQLSLSLMRDIEACSLFAIFAIQNNNVKSNFFNLSYDQILSIKNQFHQNSKPK